MIAPCYAATRVTVFSGLQCILGWSDRKRLGRLGQLHRISFAIGRIGHWFPRESGGLEWSGIMASKNA